MRTIPASEMKQRFGTCIEAAQAEPILIERSGRPSVVVVCSIGYDAYLGTSLLSILSTLLIVFFVLKVS